jgi:hypothetical protein
MVRPPKALHERITQEVGQRMRATGRQVSVNAVIVDILERFFGGERRTGRPPARKRGR